MTPPLYYHGQPETMKTRLERLVTFWQAVYENYREGGEELRTYERELALLNKSK